MLLKPGAQRGWYHGRKPQFREFQSLFAGTGTYLFILLMGNRTAGKILPDPKIFERNRRNIIKRVLMRPSRQNTYSARERRTPGSCACKFHLGHLGHNEPVPERQSSGDGSARKRSQRKPRARAEG